MSSMKCDWFSLVFSIMHSSNLYLMKSTGLTMDFQDVKYFLKQEQLMCSMLVKHFCRMSTKLLAEVWLQRNLPQVCKDK